MKKLGLINPHTTGGPASFWKVLSGGDMFICSEGYEDEPNLIVIGSSLKIRQLVLARLSGRNLILRLDGRYEFSDFGISRLHHYLALVIAREFIASILATYIVYQSVFVKLKYPWHRCYFSKKRIIYNSATDYQITSNAETEFDLIIIEGSVRLTDYWRKILSRLFLSDLRIAVTGLIDPKNESFWNRQNIHVFGHVDRSLLNDLRSKSTLHLCIERNPACPNSVIESLVNGLPVYGLHEGSLPELIKDPRTLSSYSHKKMDVNRNFDEIIHLLSDMRRDIYSYRTAIVNDKTEYSPSTMTLAYYNLLR